MKTSEKLSFPKLENEFLENILRQLVNQHNIIQMFFTKQPAAMFSYLIIHLENNNDAQQLQQNKWIKKARNRHHIDVCFIYSQKLHHRLSLGHPFFKLYCQPSALIYENEEHQNAFVAQQNWKKFKKKLDAFQEHFYNHHDLHTTQIQNLISEGSSNSVFTSYARLFEYDLEYLEELYSGGKSGLSGLDERINSLIEYIPEIQKYFVRINRNKFYLTDLFTKGKEASVNDEVIYGEEMYEAVQIAEQSLYRLIEERFDELKKGIKKGKSKISEAVPSNVNKPDDAILNIAIETITNSVKAEQIYLYHQITCHEKTVYYLMLITAGVGNEKLKSIAQSLKSKTGGKYDFIMLSHSRKWIQNNLYQHQSFFSKIVKSKYLISASSPYHPELHWEVPHKPYHADLYFYYKPAKDIAFQFFAIVSNPKENYQGLEYFFALFLMSFCRTYIFVKTYYLSDHLSSQTLWQLCVYADPDILKYNYLTENFWTDFFPYADKHMTLHHKLSKINKVEVDYMNNVVTKLMDELHNLVIENELLMDFQQD